MMLYDEASGEQLHALLNPETLTLRRTAGIRVTAPGSPDDPLIFTGGGETEIELDLLFDSRLDRQGGELGGGEPGQDVRAVTGRIWQFAESRPPGYRGDWPPPLRLIWGDWSLPVAVVALAERFEDFTAQGAPQRSWLSLRLRRTAPFGQPASDPDHRPIQGDAVEGFLETLRQDDLVVQRAGVGAAADTAGGESVLRLDLLAHEAFGDPRDWRIIAELSGLEDPLQPPADGLLLTVAPDRAETP